MRDNDKTLVYGAENELGRVLDMPGTMMEIAGSHITVPDERKFARVEDIQAFVDKVLEHTGNADKPCKVRRRKGNTKAHYMRSEQTIAIPDQDRWAMREIVVLHELAHHLSGPVAQSHGAEFRSIMCELLEAVLAPEARLILQIAYWDRNLTA